ncbi:MAG: CHASE2 domain-containing protein, partial [Spirochaetales bacterium]|nr:CHASE2 domain-containing protein [Spirochaetales bacterium]
MLKIKKILPLLRIILLLGISIILSFGIMSSPMFKDLNNFFYDFWFTFREFGKKIDPGNGRIMMKSVDDTLSDEIIIIGIDEKSINKFNSYPWSRMKYITFFDYLNSAPEEKKPTAVFLDILFMDKSYKNIEDEFYLKEPDVVDKSIIDSPEYRKIKTIIEKYQIDEPLGKSIKSCGRVYLPSHFRSKSSTFSRAKEKNTDALAFLKSFSIIAPENNRVPTYAAIMPPINEIGEFAEGIGFVTIEEDGGETLRQIPLFAQLEEEDTELSGTSFSRFYPAIDLLIALKYYDILPENIVIRWGSHITLTNALHPETGERGDV